MFVFVGKNFILLCVFGFIIDAKGEQCTTLNDEPGECVNIITCKSLMAIERNPDRTDMDNFLLKVHTAKCQYTNKIHSVCCALFDIERPETTTQKVFVPPIPESCRDGYCVDIQNCSVLLDIALNPQIIEEDKKYLRDRQCKRNTSGFSVCCPEPEQPDITALLPIIELSEPKECVTPNNVPGFCMAAKDCMPISIIHTKDDQTQEEMEFLENSQCPTQEELFCCPTAVYPETEAPTTSTTTTTATTAAPIVEICETPNGDNGTCISVIHCKPLMRILQKPEFFENDAKYLNASFCGDAANFPKVCCPEAPTVEAEEQLSLPLPPYCGAVSTAEAEFDDGIVTSSEEYPWTALLLYKNSAGKTNIYCGGTLIHERYVLTAAHCLLEQEPEWTLSGVRLGVWAPSVVEECRTQGPNAPVGCESTQIELNVSKVIQHPDYELLQHDLALLQLSAAVRPTRYITPICLSFESKLLSASLDVHDNAAASLEISGWGAHLFKELAEFKQKSVTYLSNMDECRKLYLDGGVGNLTAEHVCVRGNGADDTKVLDSGGALMSLVNFGKMQSYILLGVEALSYEITPAQGFPFIFTRIDAYLDWINSEIRGKYSIHVRGLI